jgi:polyisoprenyl-teichoic acid--peptidoglycan teichoic acid transferase
MPHAFKRKILKFRFVPVLFLLAGIFFAVIFLIIRFVIPASRFLNQNGVSPKFLFALVFNTEPPLKTYNNHTNILLLGTGGDDHQGGDLTDSMMEVSIDFAKQDAVMISIPRDIWVPSMKDRVNTAYHYGEEKKPGGGFTLVRAAVEEVTGQSSQYTVLVDFSGFKKIIDLAGGIDVNIINAFDDPLYPIAGRENDFCGGDPTFSCRYEKLHFAKGWEHMDGDRALKFVRSRHAEGDEGTDFARGRRQQQVFLALKEKLLNKSIWTNFTLLKKLYSAFNDSVTTDLTWSERLILGKYFLKNGTGNIRRLYLDTGDKEKKIPGLLVNPPVEKYKGEWILIPKAGETDFSKIHEYLSCHITDPGCTLKP